MGGDLLLLGTGIVLLAFGTVATDVETTVDSRSAREAGSKSATLSGTQAQRHDSAFGGVSSTDGGGPGGGSGRLGNPVGGSLANSSAEAKSIAEVVPLSKRASCEPLHGFPPLAPLGFFAFPPCEDIHKQRLYPAKLTRNGIAHARERDRERERECKLLTRGKA